MGELSMENESIRWVKFIRRTYPTLLFYFTDSISQRTILYYTSNGTVCMRWATLSVDGIDKTTDVPQCIARICTVEVEDVNNVKTYRVPGDVTKWHQPKSVCESLDGTHILLRIHAEIDTTSNTIDHLKKVYIDRSTRNIHVIDIVCPDHIKHMCKEVSSLPYTTLLQLVSS
jgi:hypothetical protein